MNTPRSRKPARFTVKPMRTPEGTYAPGIMGDNRELAAVLGLIISLWPHIEEEMIPLFGIIAGIENDENARLIFRSVTAQHSRLVIMRGLMTKSPHTVHWPDDYDKLIDEFDALNKIRNAFAHGRWFTHKETGDVYLEDDLATSGLIFLDARKVTQQDMRAAFDRMMALVVALKNPALYRPLAPAT